MSVKLKNRDLEKQITKTEIPRKRGRPKGSKNKPKYPQPPVKVASIPEAPKKKRGRPKGAKNKQKTEVAIPQKPIAAQAIPATPEMNYCSSVAWLIEHMSTAELQYYRKRANRLEESLNAVIAADILSFLNVQDPTIRKKIKTHLENDIH